MATFTVRVELHLEAHADASWEEYERLHWAMESEGFTRTVKDTDGVKRHLPHAEYNFIGSVTIEEVLKKSHTAAIQTGKNYALLITEAKARMFFNLDPV